MTEQEAKAAIDAGQEVSAAIFDALYGKDFCHCVAALAYALEFSIKNIQYVPADSMMAKQDAVLIESLQLLAARITAVGASAQHIWGGNYAMGAVQ